MHNSQDKLIAGAAWLIIISGRGVENLVGMHYELTTYILVFQLLCYSYKTDCQGKTV